MIDNIDDMGFVELRNLVKRLLSANPLNNSSVDRGALTIRSKDGLVVGDEESGAEGGGSAKVYGTLNVTGTLNGDGTIDWEGPVLLKGQVDLTGTLHAKGGGRVVVSESGDLGHSMQIIHEAGEARLVAFGIPMRLIAWDSNVLLAENELAIVQDGTRVRLTPDSVQIERGNSKIVLDPDESISITSGAGGFILMEGGNVRIKQKTGPGLELREGAAYLTDLPTS